LKAEMGQLLSLIFYLTEGKKRFLTSFGKMLHNFGCQ
jgi:hypothetical protein